jgi:hypothetical protein
MKALLFVLLSFFTVLSFAQNTVTWKGGTPGNENNWYTASNWDKNVVPDQDSYVIIKRLNTGHDAQPLIDEEVKVACIELQSSALLTVTKKGRLVLDGSFSYSEGFQFFGGRIFNEGIVNFRNIDFANRDAIANWFYGKGKIFVNGKTSEAQYAGW